MSQLVDVEPLVLSKGRSISDVKAAHNAAEYILRRFDRNRLWGFERGVVSASRDANGVVTLKLQKEETHVRLKPNLGKRLSSKNNIRLLKKTLLNKRAFLDALISLGIY